MKHPNLVAADNAVKQAMKLRKELVATIQRDCTHVFGKAFRVYPEHEPTYFMHRCTVCELEEETVPKKLSDILE